MLFRCESQQFSGDQEQQPMSLQMERLRLQTDCFPIVEQFSSSARQENFEQIDSEHCKRFEISEDVKQIKVTEMSKTLIKENDNDIALNIKSEESYELLSKAFVNAVRGCVLQEEQRKPRDRSATDSAQNSVDNENTNAEILKRDNEIEDELININNYKISNKKFSSLSHLLDKCDLEDNHDFQDNTPVVERMSFSAISCQSFNTIIPATKSILSLYSESKLQSIDQKILTKQQFSTSSMSSILNTNHLNEIVDNDFGYYNFNGKLCKNSSCSPIIFEMSNNSFENNKNEIIKNTSPSTTPTTSNNFNKTPKIWRPKAMRSIIPSFLSSLPSSSSFTSFNPFLPSALYSNNLHQPEVLNTKSPKCSPSIEHNYNQPKMGEPGRPGTHDLNQSMRRLNIKKKVFFLNYYVAHQFVKFISY